MLKKFLIWLICTAIIPLVPFVCNYLLLLAKGIELTPALLFGNGELLLISLFIAATGVSAIIMNDNKSKLKYIAGTICLIILIFITILYISVYSELRLGQKFDMYILFNYSKWIFVLSLIVSGSCILIPEE